MVANELAQQLAKLEQNVSDMGDSILGVASQRLVAHTDKEYTGEDLVVAPGQFQIFDTRAPADIDVALQKPKAADAGTLIVLLDIGGGTGALRIRTPDSYINDAQVKLSTAYMRLIFCDGEGYWTD